jgi:hypothetical protein
LSPCIDHGEEYRTPNSWRMKRENPAAHASLFFFRDTKVEGYARYQVRRAKSEQTWDGLVAVLVDHNTAGRLSSEKVGNQGPRDPL